MPAQQSGELTEKRQALMPVVRLPHRRLQPANLVRLEIPQAMGARRVEIGVERHERRGTLRDMRYC